MNTVPGYGPKPNDFMLIGESPGETEFKQQRPFVGKSGHEQEQYLSRHGVSPKSWYMTNVVKEFIPTNPDPTQEQIDYWTPKLEQEISIVKPKLIIAVGRFAARWFLGSVDMDVIHGLPHEAGAFNSELAGRSQGAIVLPVIHPAAGFYDNDARALIDWDYQQVAKAVKAIKARKTIEVVKDDYVGHEQYRLIEGWDLDRVLFDADVIALDTEGTPANPWSIQVSVHRGSGWVLRTTDPTFEHGIAALRESVDKGATFVLHNAMFDLEMCRAMGLDLFDAHIFDSMYAAYTLRLEPQGLKALAWRWCGMHMDSYEETVTRGVTDKQLEYLANVVSKDWPKPEPRLVTDNSGESRLYKPQAVGRRAEKILTDYYDKPEVNLLDRWKAVDQELRNEVEQSLGAFPVGSLDDIPLEDAIRYGSRDSDATLRLYYRLSEELESRGLTSLMKEGMDVLPVFEEMQATGMIASRRKFEELTAHVDSEMTKLQNKISNRYYSGKPFNPASSAQVGALLRRRGLEGTQRTSTGKVSTGKKSIEHLRFTDDAISDVMEWREHQKIRDAFCMPALERIPVGVDLYPMRCQVKVTRTATRRLATAEPNLQQVPVRNELGLRVRDCYVTPEGQVYGSWDLSQIEMRFAAHDSKDELLCRLFNEHRDVHSETAARIFGLHIDDVDDKKHRYPSKRAGFGILYGIQGEGLLTQLRMMGCEGWDTHSCDKLIKEWLKVYKGVKARIEEVKREVRAKGYVQDISGMIRYLPGVWSDDKKVAAEAERTAYSHKIQGGAQTLIQRSIIHLKPIVREMQKLGMNVHWSMQVHDEIIMRIDEELWEIVDALVVDALTNHCGMELRIPVEASGNQAQSWAKLK